MELLILRERNRRLFEAARTMLADSKLPTTFWAEVVYTSCYVQNRVLVVKPHNKTLYEFFHDPKSSHNDGSKPSSDDEKKVNVVSGKTSIELPFDPNMPTLEDSLQYLIFSSDVKVMIEAMQEELLQFKLQEVWTLVDLPNGKRVICTKWVFRNKKDKRGIVIRNKARLVSQGYIKEEGIDYDEVFAPIARIEAIRLFLAYASFKDFVGYYQRDVKKYYVYGRLKKKRLCFVNTRIEDPDFP
ncbi:putative ribonuclease H-like domain-containing protein [Tanacetum coccineum]